MAELAQPAPRFREIARGKLGDARIQGALDEATDRLRTNRERAWAELPDIEELRQRAHEIRMTVIDDLDAHVARFTAALEARGGTVYFAKTAEEASAIRRRRLQAQGCKARSEVEVDGVGGDRPERGARGGRREAGRDRPRRVHPSACRRAPGAHRRPCDREDGRPGRRAALGGGGQEGAAGARGADERRPDAASRDVPEGRGRDHRRELRRLGDRLDLSGHQRRERAARELDPARARGGHGDGAARAERRRPRRAAAAACAVGNGATADGVHDPAHGAARDSASATVRPNSTLSFWTTEGRICCAAVIARCSRAFAAARA